MVTTDSSMPTPSKPSRSFVKCHACREGHRKCKPEERDWDGKRERCSNCIAGNHPCGPNVWHESRQQRSTASAAANNLPPTLQISPSLLPTPPYTAISSSTRSHQQQHGTPTTSWSPESFPMGSFSPADESPLRDRDKGKGKGTFMYQSSNEVEMSRPSKAARNRLNRLGGLYELYTHLHARHRSVTAARPPVDATEYKEVEQLILTMKDCVRQEYMYIIREVWDSLPQEPNGAKELVLHLLREEILFFLSADHCEETGAEAEMAQAPSLDDNRKIKLMHCWINCQLATICEDAGQSSTASRHRRELRGLKERYHFLDEDIANSHEETSYQDTSERMCEASKSLNVPSRFARLLAKTGNLFPPVRLASDAGCPAVAQGLVESQSSAAASCDLLKRDAVHIAAESGDSDLLHLALDQCNDLRHSRDMFNMTALCIAAYMGHKDILMALADTIEDIKAVDISGRSVLCMASGAGHLPIVQYLLERGCRPNDQGLSGSLCTYTALHAAAAGGHEDVVDTLVCYDDASALSQFKGLTPAQEADNNGHHRLAEKLRALEKQQEAVIRDRVHFTRHNYYPDLSAEPFVLGTSMASSPFAPSRHDHPIEHGDPSAILSLTRHSPMQGEPQFALGYPAAQSQFSLYDDLHISSVPNSLASESSRQQSEASSPATKSLKRHYVPSQESSPRSSRSQPSIAPMQQRPYSYPGRQ